MTSKPTQTERVIAAARRFNGVCRIDFQLPDVCDGGPPILNFPGRMFDAERAGFSFEVIGKRNRCKIFRLVSEPDVGRGDGHDPPSSEAPSSSQAAVSPSTGHLFEVGSSQSSHYSDWEAA